MPGKDPSAGVAEAPGGYDVAVPARRHRLAVRDPGVSHPAGEPERDEHVSQARAERGNDRNHEHDEWEGEEQVDDAHDEGVHPAPGVGAGHPNRGADHERDRRGSEGDREIVAAAVQQPGPEVAAERVGPEDMPVGAGRDQHRESVDVGRGVGGEKRRAEGEHRDDQQQAHAQV